MRRALSDACIDADSLRRPLQTCDLGRCRGTCCHDGAILDEDEARVLGRLAREEAPFFTEVGLSLPPEPVVRVDGVSRLATRVYTGHDSTPAFPAHFPRTACVFLMPDFRCSLQVLSVRREHHSWHWKPIACWMHPLTFRFGDGTHTLCLPSRDNDPHAALGYPGFASWTPCGNETPGGAAAHRVLAAELDMLGRILNRDFQGEIAPAPGDSSS